MYMICTKYHTVSKCILLPLAGTHLAHPEASVLLRVRLQVPPWTESSSSLARHLALRLEMVMMAVMTTTYKS